MRDRNFKSTNFITQLDNQTEKVHKYGQDLRKQVVDNPNFLTSEIVISNFPKKLQDLEGLAILSWYIPNEIGILLRLDLEEKIKYLSTEDQVVINILLSSKPEMLIFLTETTLWSSRDFFGNILRKGEQALLHLKFKKKNWTVTIPQRKRGYHDHGSLKPYHKWKPTSDWSLTEEQNIIEEKRTVFHTTIKFLKGFLT